MTRDAAHAVVQPTRRSAAQQAPHQAAQRPHGAGAGGGAAGAGTHRLVVGAAEDLVAAAHQRAHGPRVARQRGQQRERLRIPHLQAAKAGRQAVLRHTRAPSLRSHTPSRPVTRTRTPPQPQARSAAGQPTLSVVSYEAEKTLLPATASARTASVCPVSVFSRARLPRLHTRME